MSCHPLTLGTVAVAGPALQTISSYLAGSRLWLCCCHGDWPGFCWVLQPFWFGGNRAWGRWGVWGSGVISSTIGCGWGEGWLQSLEFLFPESTGYQAGAGAWAREQVRVLWRKKGPEAGED